MIYVYTLYEYIYPVDFSVRQAEDSELSLPLWASLPIIAFLSTGQKMEDGALTELGRFFSNRLCVKSICRFWHVCIYFELIWQMNDFRHFLQTTLLAESGKQIDFWLSAQKRRLIKKEKRQDVWWYSTHAVTWSIFMGRVSYPGLTLRRTHARWYCSGATHDDGTHGLWSERQIKSVALLGVILPVLIILRAGSDSCRLPFKDIARPFPVTPGKHPSAWVAVTCCNPIKNISYCRSRPIIAYCTDVHQYQSTCVHDPYIHPSLPQSIHP